MIEWAAETFLHLGHSLLPKEPGSSFEASIGRISCTIIAAFACHSRRSVMTADRPSKSSEPEEMDQSKAEQFEIFAEYLKREGLRMTRQRELVLEAFLSAEGHLSTDELYELVRRRDGRIGYATVFRTLKALTDCGLARKTDLDDGRARFESLYRRPHHHHIVCVECSRTIEFSSPELEQLQEKIVAEYDFSPIRNKFQIFGICSACRNEQEKGLEPVDANLVFARDALKIAMETERRGVNFYQTASAMVEHEETRRTFLEMLEDEEGHFRGLKEEWDRLVEDHPEVLDAPVFLHFDYEALKKIFPSKEEVQRKLKAEMTAEEALKVAMNMERDARDFFRSYAEKFNDTEGRDIFLQFAEEEEDHFALIKDSLDRLRAARSSS